MNPLGVGQLSRDGWVGFRLAFRRDAAIDVDSFPAIDLGSIVEMTRNVYSETGGKLEEAREYFAIPASGAGTDGTHYDATFYGYDDSGRTVREKGPSGTIRRFEYDGYGRMTGRWIGTNDSTFPGGEASGTDNMVQTEAIEFDSATDDGNHYITKHTLYVEDSTTDQRVTTYTRDVFGRILVGASGSRVGEGRLSVTGSAALWWRPCATRPSTQRSSV